MSTARLISPPHFVACFSTDGKRSAEHCVTRVTRESGDGRDCKVEERSKKYVEGHTFPLVVPGTTIESETGQGIDVSLTLTS